MSEFESSITSTYSPVDQAALTLADLSRTEKTLVRSNVAQFGLDFGHSARRGATLVAATRPDEWLLLGETADIETTLTALDTASFTSVIPFTHGRALFRLTGAPATSALEKVCGVDLSDPMTPNGAVVSASVALTTCDLIRNDVEGTRSYLLMCDRSYGQYLFDALLDAATEFGVNVDLTKEAR